MWGLTVPACLSSVRVISLERDREWLEAGLSLGGSWRHPYHLRDTVAGSGDSCEHPEVRGNGQIDGKNGEPTECVTVFCAKSPSHSGPRST